METERRPTAAGKAASAGPGAHPLFAEPRIEAQSQPDGSIVLRSSAPIAAAKSSMAFWLAHHAAASPGRPFLSERQPDGTLRTLSYREAHGRVCAIAGALAARGIEPSRPIPIIAENGIDHALFMLAAYHAGQPIAPVSTPYAKDGTDHRRLAHVLGLLRPSRVFVDDAAAYAQALRDLAPASVEIIAARGRVPDRQVTAFSELAASAPLATPTDPGPTGIAKVLFTSGSTGIPKGVVNTHAMLASNQESLAAIWPFLSAEPPELVDWLPWSHTFGGNHNFNLVLRHGGHMLIDDGRPAPGLLARTVANLKQLSPTIYFNVPRGFGLLLEKLEADEALAESFFRRLRLLFYAGAALPRPLWDRLARLSERILGRPVPMTSSWGATETGPLATSAHFPLDAPGNIGVPVPGTEVRLVPTDGRLEIRCRGPNVTPGYFGADAATRAAFDAHGWLRTGDAVRFLDAAEPSRGLVFDGRIAESFKLSTGTWVNVGLLRTAVIAALAPLAEDCVLTGHDGDEIGAMVFPSLAGLQSIAGAAAGATVADLCAAPAVLAHLADTLCAHNRAAKGSSERISRALLLLEPPSLAAGEITDKGYINQRAVLTRRSDLVARLHADPAPPDVIRP